MENLKMIGLFAFIATGVGLKLTSVVNQTSPWVLLLGVIAVGYVFGLINHYRSLRS